MKKPLQLFKKLIKQIFYPLLRWTVIQLDSYSSRILVERLLGQLKYHGKECWIQWPIQVTGHDHITLGDNVSIVSYVHMWGEGGISIGNRVMIASHTAIASLTHDTEQYLMNKTVVQGKVTIEDDVWIGAHSVILPGVTLGKGAVIGAGSVVTRNVAPFTVVAGIPARELRRRNVHD